MKNTQMSGHLSEFKAKMECEGLEPVVIDTFSHYYRKILRGETGILREKDIQPVGQKDLESVSELTRFADAGKKALGQAVTIILNGGLGTSMGLTGTKSLLTIKNNKTFLEIILKQAEHQGAGLCFMNSYNTHQETISAVSNFNPTRSPHYFIQNRYPKVRRDDMKPASWSENPNLEWNPPGHGDVYISLYTSGLLQKLLDQGVEYAFISNSDNLGGTIDETILGYFSANRFPFMMEVARRTPADVKGGHLARYKDGQFVLREIAQCHKEDIEMFQNIHHHRFFNTNNIWLNLNYLKDLISKERRILLPMILNPKPLDPRDGTSPPVYQIETAMGSAISLFKGATAVQSPKNRLIPVKTCNDLLAVRSDCFILTENHDLVVNPERPFDVLKVALDPAYYGKIDLFDQRFPDGVPSLKDCESLTIEGDIRFQGNVRITGNVHITNKGSNQAVIKDGTEIDSDLVF